MTNAIILTSAAASAVYALIYYLFIKKEEDVFIKQKPFYPYIIIITLVSLAVHMLLGKLYYGYETDMGCFCAWSDMIYKNGFSSFYKSDSFTDYPPGYMYILYVIGFLRTVIGSSKLLVKMPAICFDLILGILTFSFAKKKFSNRVSSILAAFISLCPVLILNSALWGQVDSVYTTFLVVSILLLMQNKISASYLMFALTVFIKPQGLIFTPVFLLAFISDCMKNKKNIMRHIISACVSLLIITVLSLPFGLKDVISQYIGTLSSYKYATVNAFNIYGAFGLNWGELTPFLSITGYIFIILTVAYVFAVYFKGNKNYFYIAAMLAFMTYMLSTKMHERYAFAAVVFFLLAYISMPDRKIFNAFILSVFSQLINTAWVLFVYSKDINLYYKSSFVIVFSCINILILFYMIYAGFALTKKETKERTRSVQEKEAFYAFTSRKMHRLTKKDCILILIISVVYGAISFYDLGDTKAPQTYVDILKEPVSITLGEPTYVDKLIIYPSCNDINDSRKIKVDYTLEGGVGESIEIEDAEVFCWNFIDFGKTVTDITLSTDKKRIMLMEVGLKGSDGLINIQSDNAAFDEQNLIPERKTYLNSTYFDEIYHARTGYEFVHGFHVYEWTHPPLGKVFISLGIRMFGMTPFGWRFIGNIFGILMIPVFYIFAKRLFGKTSFAFLTTVLFTFDFMHFAQTRISTVDVYVTIFIIMMYMFMYEYYQSSFYDKPLGKTFVPLLLTGISFGLGAASKWTAIYACAGIAVIFFAIMYKRCLEHYALGKSEFTGKFVKTALFCVLAFVIIPIIIYSLSYIPYLHTEGTDGIKTILQNQKDIFVYHSKTVLGSKHPYASKWYTWLIMKRPIFYYSGSVSDTLKEGISSFGNPAVWWVGLAAVLFSFYLAAVKRDRKSTYLLIGYLSCLLPWIPVERTTYIYHYFPCVPFMTLMIGRCYEYFYYKFRKRTMKIFVLHTIAALILFAMFYPVISGHAVNTWYVDKFLRWFSSWTLVLD